MAQHVLESSPLWKQLCCLAEQSFLSIEVTHSEPFLVGPVFVYWQSCNVGRKDKGGREEAEDGCACCRVYGEGLGCPDSECGMLAVG